MPSDPELVQTAPFSVADIQTFPSLSQQGRSFTSWKQAAQEEDRSIHSKVENQYSPLVKVYPLDMAQPPTPF